MNKKITDLFSLQLYLLHKFPLESLKRLRNIQIIRKYSRTGTPFHLWSISENGISCRFLPRWNPCSYILTDSKWQRLKSFNFAIWVLRVLVTNSVSSPYMIKRYYQYIKLGHLMDISHVKSLDFLIFSFCLWKNWVLSTWEFPWSINLLRICPNFIKLGHLMDIYLLGFFKFFSL